MSSRIYPDEIFEKEFEKLRLGLCYCPYCFNNNLSNKDGPFQLFYDYICLDCDEKFYANECLNKSDVRDKKIDRVLKK